MGSFSGACLREKDKMKILHLVKKDSGGAGIAARRLHLGLKKIGVLSKMLVLESEHPADPDVACLAKERLRIKLQEKLNLWMYQKFTPSGGHPFNDDRSFFDMTRHPWVEGADIIHLHWVAGMIDHRRFFKSLSHKRIIWTLHDMNPFTGGCHYVSVCNKYKTGCDACPQLGLRDLLGFSKGIWSRKEEAYRNVKMMIVSPSRWLAGCAQESFLLKNMDIRTIPNGVPLMKMCPRDKVVSRARFGLPKDKFILLFGADYKTERKGLKYLFDALKIMERRVDPERFVLVTFGAGGRVLDRDTGCAIHRLGVVSGHEALSFCYSQADLFILPSTEDNFPNTVLEAMACGVPVVASDVGGIPEMVVPGETGLLAKAKSAEDLAEKICWMLEHPKERLLMGKNGRMLVEREYGLKEHAGRYLELYQQNGSARL